MTYSEVNSNEQSIQLKDVLQTLLDHKKMILVIIMTLSFLSVIYIVSQDRVYVASALAKASSKTRSEGDTGGGLAGLLGLGGQAEISQQSSDANNTISIMNSRPFLERFIDKNQLLQGIFEEDWDEEGKKWKTDSPPTLTDGYKILQDSLKIEFDPIAWTRRQIGYVVIEVRWKDGETAAFIANNLIKEVNIWLSEEMVEESEKSITFIDEQISKVVSMDVKESLAMLKTEQLRNMMLANAADDFALRVIDSALVPEFPSEPKRTQFVLLSTFFALLMAVMVVFLKVSFIPLIKQLKF